jgi:hypothetical protein
MKSILKFIFINIILLFFLISIWFFACFLLGYASNSEKHQGKIWVLYFITISLHFISSIIILKRNFKNLSVFYLLLNFLLYALTTVYLYDNT